MSCEIEKTAADAANIDDGVMDAGRWGANTVSKDYLRALYGLRQLGKIEKFLADDGHFGASNAIHKGALSHLMGYADARALQQAVQQERRHGALILTKSHRRGGYYLPSLDPAEARRELVAFIGQLDNRARRTEYAAKSARQALVVIDGQVLIGGGEECGEA